MKKTISMLFALMLVVSLLVSPSTIAATTQKEKNDSTTEQKVFPQQINKMKDYDKEQEPNNSFEQANEIPLAAQYKGTFTDNDKDYYKLEVNGEGSIDYSFALKNEMNATNEMNFGATFYDSSKNIVEPYKSTKGNSYFHGLYKLQPGIYYIKTTDLANVNNGENYILYGAEVEKDEPWFDRVFGQDRYETAALTAYLQQQEAGYWNSPRHVVLTTGTEFADALSGAPLAYHLNAPILLTKENKLPLVTEEVLMNLEIDNVTIIGGTAAVSGDVENYMKEVLNLTVNRIAGENRYETAAAVADELPETDTAVIAYGENYPDALSIAPVAAREMMPILLTDTNEVPEATEKALHNYESSYVIGGESVISEKVVEDHLPNPTRISGDDRYATSVAIAKEFNLDTNFATVATGEGFADAMTGSVYAAKFSQPLLLTPKSQLKPSVENYFKNHETRYFTILGGKNAVEEDVVMELKGLVE